MPNELSNYAIQRNFFDQVWHEEQEKAIYTFFDGEATGIDPVKGVNPDTYRPWYRGMLRHMGGVRIEIVHFIEQEDRMALSFILRGSVRKSGNPVVWSGSGFGRYAGGKIVEASNYLDHLSLFAQLDLLPEQAIEDSLAGESLFWELEQAARLADEQGKHPDPWLIRCGVAQPARSIFIMPGPKFQAPAQPRLLRAVERLLPAFEMGETRSQLTEFVLPKDTQLEVLFEGVTCAMVVVDSSDRILEASPTFLEFVDGELASCQGKRFCDLLQSEDQVAESQFFQALCSGTIATYHHHVRMKLKSASIPANLMAAKIERPGLQSLIVRGLRHQKPFTAAELLNFQQAESGLLAARLQQGLADDLATLWVHLQNTPSSPVPVTNQATLAQIRERCLALVTRIHQEWSEQTRELGGLPRSSIDLALALRELVSDFQQDYGLLVHLQLDPQLESLQGVSALFLFRIVQEALRNVAHHSGVDHAEVQIDFKEDKIRGRIIDCGRGFVPNKELDSSRLGLIGMKERCALLNGELTIFSKPGMGTRIDFTLGKVN